MRFNASPLDVSRIGIVVPRYRHTAVDRNRLKRRLRELVRLELLPTLHPQEGHVAADVSIRARREGYDAPLDALRADVRTIAAQLAARPRTPVTADGSTNSTGAPSSAPPETSA